MRTITKIEAQNARAYMEFATQVQANETIEDKVDYYEIVELPAQPTLSLHEQAMQMSMSKENFVTMVEEMTTAFSLVDPTSEPITFAKMWEWCSSDPNLLKLFITQTNVYRSDPVFNDTTTSFAPQFLQYLDMMFIYQNEIMAEIKLAKEQNRPLDLTIFLANQQTL